METDSSKNIEMIKSFLVHPYSLFEHDLFLAWQHCLARVDSECNLSFQLRTLCSSLLHLLQFYQDQKNPNLQKKVYLYHFCCPNWIIVIRFTSSQAKCPILAYSNLPLGRFHCDWNATYRTVWFAVFYRRNTNHTWE
jgi:hypothetical protein